MQTNATTSVKEKKEIKNEEQMNISQEVNEEQFNKRSTVAPVFEQRNRDKKKYKNYNNIYTKKEESKTE